MNKAIIPGSFNPIHNGHILIINYISTIYDEVIIFVANNSSKKYKVDLEKRYKLVENCIKNLAFRNVKVMFQGKNETTASFANKNNVNIIVRGLKSEVLSKYESTLADYYLDENPNLIFHYIVLENFDVSSTIIRKKISINESILDIVPCECANEIEKYYGY